MKYLKIVILVILSGIAFASVIPDLFPGYWLADIFSHFRLQYAVLLLLLLIPVILLVKKSIFPLIFVLLLLGWNSRFIVPLYPQESGTGEYSGGTLSILAMNLLASNTNYSAAIDLIREKDPDVVVLLELSPKWGEQMQVLKSEYPFIQLFPQQNNFGIGMLSRIPMASGITDFRRGFPPSILGEMELNGRQISILATHPVPPVSRERFNFRNEQLEEIAMLSAAQPGPFIVAGDLNTSSYSKHFSQLLKQGELKDSRKGFGILSTWPTDLLFMRTTLDHFLLKGDLQVLERTTEKDIGSDHLPIFLKLRF